MNTQERIAILERLLERVKGKGSRASSAGAAVREPASAVVPAAARAESPAAPPTVASAPPPAAAAPPAPPPAAVASPAPPPVASAPPAAPSVPAVAPSAPAPAPAYTSVAAHRPPSEPASGEWATAPVASSVPDTYPIEPEGEFGAGEDGLQELELSDEEIVDITVEEGDGEAPPAVAARAPSSADVEIDIEEEEEEEAPVSSRRARVAGSMDEALTGAAEQLEPEPEREVPLKTPPPESGPQAALPLPPGIEQPPLPGEYDSGVHPAEEVKVDVPAVGPTHAQLGQTIDLEEPHGPDLELDMRSRAPAAEPAQDELEAALPDASVERMRPAPSSLPPQELPEPERTERVQAHSDVAPASFARAAKPFAPSTFVELLDASLALRPD
jgi:hypothetical protein